MILRHLECFTLWRDHHENWLNIQASLNTEDTSNIQQMVLKQSDIHIQKE